MILLNGGVRGDELKVMTIVGPQWWWWPMVWCSCDNGGVVRLVWCEMLWREWGEGLRWVYGGVRWVWWGEVWRRRWMKGWREWGYLVGAWGVICSGEEVNVLNSWAFASWFVFCVLICIFLEQDRRKLLKCTCCGQLVHPSCLEPPTADVFEEWTCNACEQKTEEYLEEYRVYIEIITKRWPFS